MSKTAKKAGPKKARGSKKPVESAGSAVNRFDRVFEKIYKLVLRIPRGRVMTYGQIAQLLEDRYSPRLVGWAMHATPHNDRNIPWHRVINSRGGISTGRVILAEPDRQRLMLEAEGVSFDDRGHCDLGTFQWSPRQRAARAKLKVLKTARRSTSKVAKKPTSAKKSAGAKKTQGKKER